MSVDSSMFASQRSQRLDATVYRLVQNLSGRNPVRPLVVAFLRVPGGSLIVKATCSRIGHTFANGAPPHESPFFGCLSNPLIRVCVHKERPLCDPHRKDGFEGWVVRLVRHISPIRTFKAAFLSSDFRYPTRCSSEKLHVGVYDRGCPFGGVERYARV